LRQKGLGRSRVEPSGGYYGQLHYTWENSGGIKTNISTTFRTVRLSGKEKNRGFERTPDNYKLVIPRPSGAYSIADHSKNVMPAS